MFCVLYYYFLGMQCGVYIYIYIYIFSPVPLLYVYIFPSSPRVLIWTPTIESSRTEMREPVRIVLPGVVVSCIVSMLLLQEVV